MTQSAAPVEVVRRRRVVYWEDFLEERTSDFILFM